MPRKNLYKPNDKIIIDLPQYDIRKGVAKVVKFYDGIYEIKLSKEIYDHNGKVRTILFLPKVLVHTNSKPQPKKKKRVPRTKNKRKLLLENPDPENIAYVHKYMDGPFAGQVREVPITKESKREDRVCPECGKEFPNSHPAALRQHIYRSHTKEGGYEVWGKKAKARWKKIKDSRGKTRGTPGNNNPLLWTTFNCTKCGMPKQIKIAEYEVRKKKSKSGDLYCSKECFETDIGFKAIRDKLFQQAILDAEFKCQHCSYDKSFDMYFIKASKNADFKNDITNVIVLCKNCRDLWETGEATVDAVSKSLIMVEEDGESTIDDYSIDMDDILSQIGDVDDNFKDE